VLGKNTESNSASLDDISSSRGTLADNLENDLKKNTNSCAKYFKYLLVVLSYAASIFTLSLGLIYSKKIPPANQYCLLCSFYIGIFGNMLILNPLRVLINSLLLPYGYSSRLLSLILSKEAI
jgi:hypothetical protein